MLQSLSILKTYQIKYLILSDSLKLGILLIQQQESKIIIYMLIKLKNIKILNNRPNWNFTKRILKKSHTSSTPPTSSTFMSFLQKPSQY